MESNFLALKISNELKVIWKTEGSRPINMYQLVNIVRNKTVN